MTRWIPLVLLTALGWFVGDRAGLAAAQMFAAVIAAGALALTGRGPAAVPAPLGAAAQGVMAASVGLLVQRDTLTGLGDRWPIVVGVVVGTLVLSVLSGFLLALHRDVDRVTGALAMTAGGAAGLVAMARELGADDRIVAVVQYLRVAAVVLTMPMIVTFVFAPPMSGGLGGGLGSDASLLRTVAVIAGVLVVGTLFGRLARLPAPATLGPLIVGAVCEFTGLAGGVRMPAVVLAVALVLIGWQVGLAFTMDSLRTIARILPLALLLTVAIGVLCAGSGVLLARLTGVGLLEGYLATTPGGLSAVLAVSASTPSDVTLIAAAQVLRVVLMLVFAPLLAAVLTRRS